MGQRRPWRQPKLPKSNHTSPLPLPLPMPTPSKLAIIAGGGELPKLLVAACEQQQRPYLLVAVAGEADNGGQDQWFSALPHLSLRLGAAASLLDQLPAAEVQAVVFAGRINRPSLASLKPDWATTKLAMKVGLHSLGDDGLLRALAGVLEERGIAVIGAQEVLADLLAPAGQLGAHPLPADSRADVSKGLAVAHALAPHDVGHAVVVQLGVVLAVEAAEGTDRMLSRIAELKKPGHPPVLVKLAKTIQDVRLDLPAIGTQTIATAAQAGIGAIVVSAGKTLLLERDALVAAADAAGIALMGWEDGAL